MKWFWNKSKKEIKNVEKGNSDIRLKYNAIDEAIFNHLSMKTTGALLLTGDWGSGKTYYVKNFLFDRIESETEYIPIIVSLYGEKSRLDIAKKVIFAYFDKKGGQSQLSTSTIAKNLKSLSDAVPIINKYFDVEKLITGAEENIFSFLPHEKMFICFDDIERLSEDTNTNDFLGLVNELVENKKSKVLLIANEEEIKKGITFKEKTIEKTVQYVPDIPDITEELFKSYKDDSFYNYFKSNKNFIINSINPEFELKSLIPELRKSLLNIRTLKFAIEHFRYIYQILADNLEINDEIVQRKLKNIWAFTLAISVEFRKPNNITFRNCKDLDTQVNINNEFDSILWSDKKVDKTEEETIKNWSYPKKIKEIYFKRISEPYIFYPNIYNLITSGLSIDKTKFLQFLDKQFNIEKGKVNPAHELLDKFMRQGWWNFTDVEFQNSLNNLYNYVEKSVFRDIISYLNSGVYLLGFSELFEKSKEQIIHAIKTGLSTFLNQSTWNHYSQSQFEMFAGEFSKNELLEVVQFIRKRLSEINESNIQEEAKSLEKIFISDTTSFFNQLSNHSSDIRSPDKPILHLLDKKKVIEAIQSMEPSNLMELSNFLKHRYLDTSFADKLIAEKAFLKYLEEAIQKKELNSKSLSNHIINTILNPRVKECINFLERMESTSYNNS